MSARTRAVRRHSTRERSPRPAPPERRSRRRVSSLRAVPRERHGWGTTRGTSQRSDRCRELDGADAARKTTARPGRHVEHVTATTPADGEQTYATTSAWCPPTYTLAERHALVRRRTCTTKRQSDKTQSGKATKRRSDKAAKRQKTSVTGGAILSDAQAQGVCEAFAAADTRLRGCHYGART